MALSDVIAAVNKTVKRDDIRGVYGRTIDDEFAHALGLSLAEVLDAGTAVAPVNVVIGHDMRLSGPALAEGVSTGLEDGGCRPILLGRAGTELVGFLVAKYADVIDGGVMITASHNPKDYNGFKFYGRGGMPLPLAALMPAPEPEDPLQRIALGIRKRRVPQRLRWDEFAPDYMRTVVEKAGCDLGAAASGAASPLRVAVEAGNGMGGPIMRELAALAPQFEWTFAHDVPDGSFPVIVPNPLNAGYQQMIGELVRDSGSHVGFCLDGDADRCAVCDERGQALPPPMVTALVGARLRRRLGRDARIAFNLATSWVVPDTLGRRDEVLGDGDAVMTPVGYSKIKPIMHADPRIAFGAEHSAHYMFREFWGADSGMMAGVLMLEIVAELHAQGKSLSGAVQGFRSRYHESGEINFQLPADRPGDDVIAQAVRQFRGQVERLYVVVEDRVRTVDAYPPEGLALSVSDVRAEARDWWFCMRKSGTEAGAGDLLRLYVEADGDQGLMERQRDALVELIGPDLRIG
jgi:phosphomannomutase